MPSELKIAAYQCAEWTLRAHHRGADPWRTVEAFALVNGRRVPGFWAGEDRWTFRLTENHPGRYDVLVESNDPALSGQRTTLNVEPHDSHANPLFRHGPVRMSDSGRSFSYADGTPFFWFGDTWWMQMSDRVAFPDDFETLVRNRADLGFSVIQTVVGFPPDSKPQDRNARNEGGAPWADDYASINPAYFDAADRRLRAIIDRGMVPCILGTWGYHLLFTGEETMRAHWRYLVARYSAWPVMFCLAGETAMRYYLSPRPPEEDVAELQQCWSRVGTYVRQLDPYRRPLTTHPRSLSFDDLSDASMLDFDMIQSGHMQPANESALTLYERCRVRTPRRPFVQAEPPYEGHGGTNGPDIQRYAFWSALLSGAAGYTYGAAGIFQANDRTRPPEKRPDGAAFDRSTWDQAMHFPGASQLGRGAQLLASLDFDRFETHPEWCSVALRWGQDGYRPPFQTFAAGVPGVCRVVYIPMRWYHWDGPTIRALEPGTSYKVTYVDPDTFDLIEAGTAVADPNGEWTGPIFPYMHDWVVVLRADA